MRIKLKTLREDCGGCPTSYSGETYNGDFFSAYLRNGFMRVELNGRSLFTENPYELDGVCSFYDFKKYALKHSILIEDENAEFSSYIDDINRVLSKWRS